MCAFVTEEAVVLNDPRPLEKCVICVQLYIDQWSLICFCSAFVISDEPEDHCNGYLSDQFGTLLLFCIIWFIYLLTSSYEIVHSYLRYSSTSRCGNNVSTFEYVLGIVGSSDQRFFRRIQSIEFIIVSLFSHDKLSTVARYSHWF